MHTLDNLDASSLRDDVPAFRAGDTVKVHVKVIEGTRSRIQVFQGIVIRRSGGGIRETFTVRKISFGVGVERTFPVHSPSIAKLEIVQRGRVRRAQLYYLRDLRGQKARIPERRIDDAKLASLDAAAAEAAGGGPTTRCAQRWGRPKRQRRRRVRPPRPAPRPTSPRTTQGSPPPSPRGLTTRQCPEAPPTPPTAMPRRRPSPPRADRACRR